MGAPPRAQHDPTLVGGLDVEPDRVPVVGRHGIEVGDAQSDRAHRGVGG